MLATLNYYEIDVSSLLRIRTARVYCLKEASKVD